MKYPEEVKAYNKRHGVEVKVALDVFYDEDGQEVEDETR